MKLDIEDDGPEYCEGCGEEKTECICDPDEKDF